MTDAPPMFNPETPEPPPQIKTTEEAINYLESRIARVERDRAACSTPGATIQQQSRFAAFLIRHGHALGLCDGFLRAGLIGPVAYNQFVTRIRHTMLSTVTSSIAPPNTWR